MFMTIVDDLYEQFQVIMKILDLYEQNAPEPLVDILHSRLLCPFFHVTPTWSPTQEATAQYRCEEMQEVNSMDRMTTNGADEPNVPDPLNQMASNLLGVPYLYPYQRLIVNNILEAAEEWRTLHDQENRKEEELTDRYEAFRSQIAILPTGSGKSLCFQLPAPLLHGPTVVVFPLLSLMADQERRLADGSVTARVLRGGQTSAERNRIWKEVMDGTVCMLLTNPETLCNERVISRLRRAQCAHVVVDEAHCVSEWGETFRPKYRELASALERLQVPLVTAFTATASPTVLSAVKEILFQNAEVQLIEANPDRPNITYRVVPSIAPLHTVAKLLGAEREEAKLVLRPKPNDYPPEMPRYPEFAPVRRPVVVFCRTRKRAELVADYLRGRSEEREIFFYHAGLSREEKNRIENWFHASTDGVLCATCAYGMGVDKKNIRTVIHFDTPATIEAYIQEAGRAGRDRNHAEAILVVGTEGSRDSQAAGSAREGEDEAERMRQTRQRQMDQYARSLICRRRYLLSLLGTEPEACFGCDICNGTSIQTPDGKTQIRKLLRRAPRRYTRALAAERLTKCARDARKRPALDPSWTLEDAEDAITALERSGCIHQYRHGPWRHLLSARREKKPVRVT